jgi:hypothetical protein
LIDQAPDTCRRLPLMLSAVFMLAMAASCRIGQKSYGFPSSLAFGVGLATAFGYEI